MKILLTVLTHGDETAGIKVAKQIKQLELLRGEIIVHRVNEAAYRKRKRFLDQDMNRVFPGNVHGNHEQKIATKILPMIKSADIVIDIHTTKSELRDALIVTKLNKRTQSYIKAIRPKYLLRMSATKHNALISNAKVGIAFEYGKNGDKKTVTNTVKGIKNLLNHLGMIQTGVTKMNHKTRYFDVYRTIAKPKSARLLSNIKNYRLVRKGEPYARIGIKKTLSTEDFYPVLFGQNNYKEIFGFAARAL